MFYKKVYLLMTLSIYRGLALIFNILTSPVELSLQGPFWQLHSSRLLEGVFRLEMLPPDAATLIKRQSFQIASLMSSGSLLSFGLNPTYYDHTMLASRAGCFTLKKVGPRFDDIGLCSFVLRWKNGWKCCTVELECCSHVEHRGHGWQTADRAD